MAVAASLSAAPPTFIKGRTVQIFFPFRLFSVRKYSRMTGPGDVVLSVQGGRRPTDRTVGRQLEMTGKWVC
jgi:hypothetical protein